MASRHLLNPLASLDEPTPSSLDGIDEQLERDLRACALLLLLSSTMPAYPDIDADGSLLIRQAGIMIQAPQIVTATAQTLFQRFWFVSSMRNFQVDDTAAGALFLASKLEETPVRMRDIVNSFAYMDALVEAAETSSAPTFDPSSFKSYEPMDYFATEFYDRKDAIVVAEMQILKRLGFHTQSGLPYGHLANYCQVLELADDNGFVRQAWGHLNDMFHTDIPAKYPQFTMAAAAIYLVSRKQQVALPLEPVPWWQLFDASEKELVDIVDALFNLYRDWEGSSAWSRIAKLPRSKSAVRDTIRSSQRVKG